MTADGLPLESRSERREHLALGGHLLCKVPLAGSSDVVFAVARLVHVAVPRQALKGLGDSRRRVFARPPDGSAIESLADGARQQEEKLDVARHLPRDDALARDGLDERDMPSHQGGHGLGDNLLVARVVEAEEFGEHPGGCVDRQGGVDVSRVDALDVHGPALG